MFWTIALWVIGVVGLALVGFLIYVALQPAEFRIVRVGQIDADPATVFGMVNNMRTWNTWSPWMKLDPNAKLTYEGPEEGVGAGYTWDGKKNMGSGKLSILDSQPHEHVQLKLEFFRPFVCQNYVVFDLDPTPSGTQLTWVMSGRNNFIAKIFDVLINMDKMCGNDFEKGFENMNRLASTPRNQAA